MLPIQSDERQRWMVELDEAEKFRDREFGKYRQENKTTGAGVNIDYFEYGADVREDGKRAPINLAFVLGKNIVPLLFPNNPKVLALPLRKMDAASAPVAASVLNHYIRFLKLKATDQQTVFDSWLLGYGVSKVGYLSPKGMDIGRTDQEEKRRLSDKMKERVEKVLVGLGLKQPVEQEPPPLHLAEDFLRTENPYVRWVNPFDFYIDPRARNIQDAWWVAERYQRTLWDIKQNTHYSQERFRLELGPTENKDIPSTQLERFQTAELYEIHYKNPKSPTGITILILAQARGSWVTLYHEHSVYERLIGWQYQMLAFNKHNHRLYPVADLSHVRPLLDRLNNTFTAIIEQVEKFVAKVVVNNDKIGPEGLTNLTNSAIGSVVKVNGTPQEVVEILEMTQVKQDLLVLVDKVTDLIIIELGMTRAQLTGLSTAQTATEAQIGQGGSTNRRTDQSDSVMEYLTEQVEALWAVIVQFVDLEELQLLTGEPTYEDETGLPKYSFLDDITGDQSAALQNGNYRFAIEVTSMQRPNMEILRKQVENLITVLANQAINLQLAQQGKMLDVAEGLRVALRLYPELIADPNRIIRPISPAVQQGYGGLPQAGVIGPPQAEAIRQAPAPNQADIVSETAGEKGMMGVGA